MHFRGKVPVICKCTERVDCGMDEDTGQQTSAAIKNVPGGNRDRKDNPAKVIHKVHPAAVEQVDNMPDAEGYA